MSENLKLPTIQVDFGNATINTAETITDFIEGKNEMHIYDERATRIRDYAFYYFPLGKLRSVEMPNVTEIGRRAFWGCVGIHKARFPKLQWIMDEAFASCGAIGLDVRNVTHIGKRAFAGSGPSKILFDRELALADEAFADSRFQHIVIRTPRPFAIPEYKPRLFENSLMLQSPGFIYVPTERMEQFKNAEGWNQIRYRAVEDYTVDGTTWGEIDWDKMKL